MEKKILIIDDDADIRFTVREICKLRKWRTLEAACYEEAAPLLERERPDLILMDGGRGQVNIALKVLEELGINIPVCGMVKDDHHKTRGLYYNNAEIPVDAGSEGFRLITRIQDEAHRFAIEFHRSLRSKEQVHSLLDDIPGIGETRRKALMRKFKSLENIRDASLEELTETESMNAGSAQQVYDFFHVSNSK